MACPLDKKRAGSGLGLGHAGGIEGAIELLLSDTKFLETFRAEFADGSTAGDGFLGDLRCGIVADDGSEA